MVRLDTEQRVYYRRLLVGDAPQGMPAQAMRLLCDWLTRAGFRTGDVVEIRERNGELTVRKAV